MRATAGLLFVLVSCSPSGPAIQRPELPSHLAKAVPELTSEQQLNAARDAFEATRYPEAEKLYRAAARDPSQRALAELGLLRLDLVRGRYASVLSAPAGGADLGPDLKTARGVIRAQALRATGNLDQALAALAETPRVPGADEATLLHGEILIEQGKRAAAEAVLVALEEAYNTDAIAEDDSDRLGLVARAEQLLRSPADANEAFNEAEQAGSVSVQTLLWRAELYLDNNDGAHAAEVLEEVLKRAPNHPEALSLSARLRIEETVDFGAAERLAARALEVNPQSTQARAVLGALRLRDMDLTRAKLQIDAGLEVNPRSLPLLSLLGALAFLGDDREQLEQLEQRVLGLSAGYSAFYTTVGLYAEWEHRYADIVQLMLRAVAVDPLDGRAWAQLGLNQIRGGDDSGGVEALKTAFRLDPYNVRVFNTLNLFEQVIPERYVTAATGQFRIRYPLEERAVLQRYVPELLNAAWEKMKRSYDFTPKAPIGVELYSERAHFAIRTSGLPDTAIQGVCFGQTLATVSPSGEHFNLGMTLWHELSHVFHIQLSQNHVPRWFTEGLAEYETLIERPEWQREGDADLYLALKEQRLPKLGSMNEAFTHAEEMRDVAVAYYASTQIVRMLAEQFGYSKLRQMLVLWGEGKRTDEVMQLSVGQSTQALDERFQSYVRSRLMRYESQFVPSQRVGNPEEALRAVRESTGDAGRLTRVARLAADRGELAAAQQAVAAALVADPTHADALWLRATIALQQGNREMADASAASLLSIGKDGYETQMLLARSAEARGDAAGAARAFEAAHQFDPSQRAALDALRNIAKQSGSVDAELQRLRQLVRLDEHDGAAHRDLMSLLLERREFAEASEVGRAAVNADMESAETHLLYARALEALGQNSAAEYEFTSAALCPGDDDVVAQVEDAVAEYWTRRADVRRAREFRQRAAARRGKAGVESE